jgi:hypothetical protein
MRIRSLIPVIALLAVACTDRGTLTVPGGSRASRDVITPQGTLDDNISTLIALFPNGLSTAASSRWSSVKRKYQAGLTDPSQMSVAQSQLFNLSDWVQKKAPTMDTPPNGESQTNAATRLILYMALYVYGGPLTPPPATGGDVVVGLVTPSAPATIVTPTMHAGVALDAGSVGENTIVVIAENPQFYEQCSGPLVTPVCQYPLFYAFNEFPHKRLLKAGSFAVCHAAVGSSRGPDPETHKRVLLAHTLPGDPADYTPGSLIAGNAEILPYTTQSFSTCADVTYGSVESVIGMSSALGWLAHAVAKAVTPKSAYAIDQGGGGTSLDFSDFNVVDPLINSEFISVTGGFSAPTSVGNHSTTPDATKKVGRH